MCGADNGQFHNKKFPYLRILAHHLLLFSFRSAENSSLTHWDSSLASAPNFAATR